MELTEDDLTPRAKQVFERVYSERPRDRASRDDIAAGFIGALVWLNSKSSFKPEAHATVEQEHKRLH
jgi:hypothetical protein